MIAITPLYAGLLALLFLWLSYNVVQGRRSHKVSVGDGENSDLRKRMRVQANFVEYAPIGLLLIALLELQSAPALWLHGAGLALLLGRLFHAYGFGHSPQIVKLRVWGMYLTLASLFTSALGNILGALIGGFA